MDPKIQTRSRVADKIRFLIEPCLPTRAPFPFAISSSQPKWRQLVNFCRQITRRKLAPDVTLFSSILPALVALDCAGQEGAAPGGLRGCRSAAHYRRKARAHHAIGFDNLGDVRLRGRIWTSRMDISSPPSNRAGGMA